MNRSLVLSAAMIAVLPFASSCRRSGLPKTAPAESNAEKPSEVAEPSLPTEVRLTPAAISEAGIQTWKVQQVDLEHVVSLGGTVEHDENALLQVASSVKGRVVSIPVDLGESVRKGDPIVEIESIELAHSWDELIRQEAELRVAKRALDRANALFESKAISTAERDSRQATYLSRRAEADTAARNLVLQGETESEIAEARKKMQGESGWLPPAGPHRVTIRAPFAGRILERKVTPGALVEALAPLATLANTSSVWVFLKAYEKDLALLHEGLGVSIRAEAFPSETFRGRIDFIGGTIDEATRTLRVRATVRNANDRLRPGMFVKAIVEVPRPANEPTGALAVPEAALQTLEGRVHVFVETEPEVFVRHVVETGHTFEGFTEVLSGVKLGDKVVTEGSFVLKSEFAKATLVEEE